MNLHAARGRLPVAAALAISAVVALAGVVRADSTTGQTGHYSFRDQSLEDSPVVCEYDGHNPYRLVKVIVKPPRLWWPDTDSGDDMQHGKVGWRAIIRVSLPGAYGPWQKVKQSQIFKATAYEDIPAYDLNDDAPFSKIAMSFNPSNYSSDPNAYISVRIKGYWYTPSGALMGTATHDVFYYKYRDVPGADGGTTACQVKMTFI